MSQVIVTFKVMPADTNVNLDNLEKEIKALINPERISREPIAFGLVALNIIVFVEDEGGQLEAVENKLNSIKGVNGFEVTGITRTL